MTNPNNLLPTESDVQFYRTNGYWLAPKVLTDEELEAVREHHAKVIAGEYNTTRAPWSRNIEPGATPDKIVKIDNSYWADSVIARAILHPLIGAMAVRLNGSKGIRLWHDQLLYKPPQTGAAGNVGWHQDFHYWQCTDPPELLTAWLALDDVDGENGCMQVVPGSHRWGLLPEGDFWEQDLAALQHRIEAASGRPFETACCILPAGAVSFHHCLTIHGSGPNLSQRPRRSIAIHLFPDGTRYKADTPSNGHMNVHLLGGRDGDPFAGPYFPLLYSESLISNAWDTSD
jgi:ectoine hydroxylase-related dioxygenase (phytanoyl-CoA dioxygenase family)